MGEIRIKHQCDSCHGTGLYSGMGESEQAAVVCYRCKGLGWSESVFTEFTSRKKSSGIRRVYQTNPGIKIGTGNGHTLEDFGGAGMMEESMEQDNAGTVRVERVVRRWTCEWNGMEADFEAETRSKARYMAYKVLNEWWNLKDLLAIKVTVSKNLTGTLTSNA